MEELRKKIIDICNESGLPLEAIYFIVKDIWRDVEATLREYSITHKTTEDVEINKEEED